MYAEYEDFVLMFAFSLCLSEGGTGDRLEFGGHILFRS